jgi:Cu2+-exporting ATPase
MEAAVGGVKMRLGSAEFVREIAGAAPPADATASDDLSRVWLGGNRGWIASFELSDRIRPASAEVVRALRARGLRLLVLSGDEPSVVRSTAARLGIDDALGALSPAAKQARVRELQARGAVVAMVGDGVNDAPVLAQAQVSIAMGSGAVVSQAQADLVLLEGRLERLVEALQTSRAAIRVVRQNLWWALLYNLVALPLAVTGHVTPWLAGVGMAGSSLAVVLNALRLAASPARRDAKREGSRHEVEDKMPPLPATVMPRA